MEFRELQVPGRKFIDSYLDGGFRVGGLIMPGSVTVHGDEALPWTPVDPAAITAADLALFKGEAARGLEILVLGQGVLHRPVPPALRQALRGWGLALEAMTTPAACRTYNILAGEGRRVAAALLVMP